MPTIPTAQRGTSKRVEAHLLRGQQRAADDDSRSFQSERLCSFPYWEAWAMQRRGVWSLLSVWLLGIVGESDVRSV